MKDLSKYRVVGSVTENIINITKFNSSGQVYVAPGLIKHIKKHLKEFSVYEKEDIYSTMVDIFNCPDYIGVAPLKAGKSFELIKKIENNVLLAVEIDEENNYNYVSSMYVVTDGKIKNRLNSSRIVESNSNIQNEVALEEYIDPKEITTAEESEIKIKL